MRLHNVKVRLSNVSLGWLNIILGTSLGYWSVRGIIWLQAESERIYAEHGAHDVGGLSILFLIFIVIPISLLFVVAGTVLCLKIQKGQDTNLLPFGYPIRIALLLLLLSSYKIFTLVFLVICFLYLLIIFDYARKLIRNSSKKFYKNLFGVFTVIVLFFAWMISGKSQIVTSFVVCLLGFLLRLDLKRELDQENDFLSFKPSNEDLDND